MRWRGSHWKNRNRNEVNKESLNLPDFQYFAVKLDNIATDSQWASEIKKNRWKMASRTTTNCFCVDCFEFEWPKIYIDFFFGNIFEAFICIHNNNDRQQHSSDLIRTYDWRRQWFDQMNKVHDVRRRNEAKKRHMRMRSIFRHRIASESQRRAPNEMDSFGTKPKNCTEKLKVIFESSKNIIPSWRRHFSDRVYAL